MNATTDNGGWAPGSGRSNRSTTELEREGEEIRADLDRTLDEIERKLSPGELLDRSVESGRGAVRFLEGARDWSGELVRQPDAFVTGIGATTTYPDYKPAPFIVSSQVDGVDCVTVGYKSNAEIDEAIENLNLALA